MNTRTLTALAAAAALLMACGNSGSSYVPVIDGPVGPNFNADLNQCQGIAASQQQFDGGTATTAATTAGAAAVGSVIINDNSDNLLEAAAAGAVVGIASDALEKNAQRESIIKNCMRGRGYNVIG
jgi:hypothetical protein